jgi:alpha-tubulin suppressor-like RCC1 family protein
LVTGVANVTRMALGFSHSCVITNDSGGTVICWGANSGGQLGHDSATDASCAKTRCTEKPQAVVLANAAEIAAASVTTFVIANATIFGFGDNSYGQLGLGTMDATPHPVPKPILQGVTIASGAAASAACTWVPQQATCWGSNEFGALAANNVGTKMILGPTVRAIDASAFGAGSGHLCALSQSDVLCWGWSGWGQAGHDPKGEPNIGFSSSEYQTTPRVVAGLSAVQTLAVGAATNCALQADNRILCWGRNANGESGHDPAMDPLTALNAYKCNWNPIVVAGLP